MLHCWLVKPVKWPLRPSSLISFSDFSSTTNVKNIENGNLKTVSSYTNWFRREIPLGRCTFRQLCVVWKKLVSVQCKYFLRLDEFRIHSKTISLCNLLLYVNVHRRMSNGTSYRISSMPICERFKGQGQWCGTRRIRISLALLCECKVSRGGHQLIFCCLWLRISVNLQ